MRVIPFIGFKKLGFCTWEMAFDRPSADVENAGDFVIREILQIPQHQELSFVDPEPTQGMPHSASTHLVAENFLWLTWRIAMHPGANRLLVIPNERLPTFPSALNFSALLERDPI
jgi:hypothetical protein